ncbi:MAG: MFS transporter [Acidimicrobiales bacterium]
MARLDPLGDFRAELRAPMRWLLLFRFISNTGVRFAYSFLDAIARGTGLSNGQLGAVLALRDLSGAAAPAVGSFAQRSGTVRVMGIGATLATLSYFVATAGATGFIIGMIVSGIGKIAFDVGMNTWVGDVVAYERRARASGLVELAWAAAALVGLPLCGVLIDQFGWQAAPALLGLAGLAPMLAINRLHGTSVAHVPVENVRLAFDRTAIGALIGFNAMTLASQFLIVGHGLWLDDAYGLDATQIGLAVISIGVIEAIASTATATFTDALGKRRAVLGGLTLMLLACVLFVANPSPPLALGLANLAVAFLGFEFALVSTLPLLAELDPVSRAKMLGLALGSSTVMRAAGSPIGIALFDNAGWGALMLAAAVAALVAIAAIGALVVEPATDASIDVLN